MHKKDVYIIGGGAAGFFCAANLDAHFYNIYILEQNADVLQKVKISGGGRCNVTHACFDPRELVKFYPRGNKELLSVFSKFQPGDTMEWFENRNVSLKIEDDNRVFPESNSSQSIINTLTSEAQQNNTTVICKCVVKTIKQNEDKYHIETSTGNYVADIIIYTTGSAPKSLKLIESLGHKLVSPVPSLFTFNIKDPLISDLPGTSFAQSSVRIPVAKSEESGPMLITHWGLSGPAILKLSAWEARRLADLKYNFDIEVNFIDVHLNDAIDYLNDYKEEHPKKSILQGKPFDVTNRFWSKVLETNQINEQKQWSNISKKEVQNIAETLCRKKMKVNGKSTFKDEFVTAGGVDLKEIDFKTMKSKFLPNFYIAGEVLNIDAVTGGFNFQACWSEAWLIAQDLNSNTF